MTVCCKNLWVYDPSDNDKLKTKLATAIAKVIGISDDLKKFDNIRADLKAHKHAKESPPTHKKEQYDHLIAVLQSQILHTKGELKDKVRKYELEHHKKKDTCLSQPLTNI